MTITEIHHLTLNPNKLTHTQSRLLHQFLQYQLQQGSPIVYQGIAYPSGTLTYENGLITEAIITLTHTVAIQKKENHLLSFDENQKIIWRAQENDCYYIYSNTLYDVGGSSMILAVAATLTALHDGSFHASYTPRIIKVIQHNFQQKKLEYFLNANQNEAAISGHFAYLGTIKLIIEPAKTKTLRSHLIMKKIDGVSLDFILDMYLHTLNVTTRIRLAKNILRELRKIHIKKIAHRDIKPKNILINLNTQEVKIVDFGLSRHFEEADKGKHGTLGFVPPEAYTKNYPLNHLSDIWSAGIVLWLLFNTSEIENISKIQYNFIKAQQLPPLPNLRRAFKYTLDIRKEHREMIINLLSKMTNQNPEERISLDDAIKILDNIELERKFPLHFSSELFDLINAHSIGIEAYHSLNKISVAENRIQKIQAIITDAVNMVGSSSTAIAELIDSLDIKVFKKLRSNQQILQILKNTMENFHQNADVLVDLHREGETYHQLLANQLTSLQESYAKKQLTYQLQALFLQIDNSLYKIHTFIYDIRYPATLDNLHNFNQNLNKKIPLFQQRLATIKSQITPLLSCDNILNHLQITNDHDEMTAIKNGIKIAIKNYIQTTLTWKNIQKKDRSASLRRCKNMNELITIMERATTKKNLLTDLRVSTYRINGLFGHVFNRSLLCKNVNAVIFAHRKKPGN